jgi:hypothetical protein
MPWKRVYEGYEAPRNDIHICAWLGIKGLQKRSYVWFYLDHLSNFRQVTSFFHNIFNDSVLLENTLSLILNIIAKTVNCLICREMWVIC